MIEFDGSTTVVSYMMLGERVMAMRVSVTVAAGAIVLMLAAVPAVLMTGCGGGGEQTVGVAPGPGSGIGGMETHEIGPMVVQTEKTAAFKAETIPTDGDCTLLAFTGAQINYLASTAMMDRFVFSSNRDGASGTNLYTCNFDGSKLARLTSNAAYETYPRWSPDGTRIAFTREWVGENARICTINADGTGAKALTDGSTHDTFPTWSPDGGQIAYMADMGSSVHDLWIMHAADGSNAVNMTSSDDDEKDPAWSPDGSQLLYASDKYGSYYQLMFAGYGDVFERITDDTNDYAMPVWHPKGWCIAFTTTERHGIPEIELMNMRDKRQRNFTSSPSADISPSFSSDGRYISYTSNRSGIWDIWVQESYLSEYGWGDELPGAIRAYQVTSGGTHNIYGDMGSPTVQTERVLIGEPGTDLFGNDPIYPTAPAAIVALAADGYRSMVRIGVAAAHLAGMQIKPLANPGWYSSGVEVSAAKVANLRQDGGLGRAPQIWDLNALNAGMVILHFNADTGKLSSVIPIQETAYTSGAGTDSQSAPYSAAADGDGMRLTGAFAAVFDAEGRNLAPSGASSVTLGRDGQVLSAD